jgi:ATP-dependent Lon protease
VLFDPSSFMFICTKNVLDTATGAAARRMEVIQPPGYTAQEAADRASLSGRAVPGHRS